MNPALPRLQEKALRLTTAPGVYLMKNKQGEIIYVGKAKNLKNRVTSYFRPHNKSHNDKVRRMVSQVEDFDYIVVGSEFEALVLECSLIKQNNPKYNILLKDDKGYHYIRISNEEYPRIIAEKQRLEDGAEYLGPYTGSFGVTQAVDEVNRLFGLATCKRQPKSFGKERPCLQYHIRQCKGVCRGNIPAEEYREWVAQAVVYLKKGGEALYERLERKMQEAAEALDFEQAARIRDQLNAMRKLPQRQSVIMLHIDSADVVAFAQNGETAAAAVLKVRNCKLVDKEDFLFYDVDDLAALRQAFFNQYYLSANELPRRILTDSDFEDSSLLCDYLSSKKGRRIGLLFPQKGEGRQLIEMAYKNAGEKVALAVSRTAREVTALQELQQLLGLSATPNRIEAYDISNLGDSHMVGGMVVYENGRPKKKDYRRFKIKDVAFQNDYAAMAEVLTRRLQHTDEGFGPLPDLILLDGGKGHVSAVLPVVTALAPRIPLFGMVKDSHHRTRAIAADGGELSISGNRAVFTFLSRLQDEVHRYTISYQQASHKKSSLSLALTKVEGIGPARAAALLKAFPTRAALLAADPAALRKAGRLSEKTAQAVYDFLHQA